MKFQRAFCLASASREQNFPCEKIKWMLTVHRKNFDKTLFSENLDYLSVWRSLNHPILPNRTRDIEYFSKLAGFPWNFLFVSPARGVQRANFTLSIKWILTAHCENFDYTLSVNLDYFSVWIIQFCQIETDILGEIIFKLANNCRGVSFLSSRRSVPSLW